MDSQVEAKKTAFVLSGGANRGALEVGVLQVLLEHDILPQILVGTSVGAINSAFLAMDPAPEGARRMEQIWLEVSDKLIGLRDYITAYLRFITGKSSIYDSKKLRGVLESYFPKGVRRFSDIKKVELYIAAVDLHAGELHVFGHDGSDSIIDAVMASSAVPMVFTPWLYDGRSYVDGGLVSDLPLRVAVDAGATELYAIDIGPLRIGSRSPPGVFRVVGQSMDAVISHQLVDEYSHAGKLSRGAINYIRVEGFDNIHTWDFGRTAEMIARGRQTGLEHLRKRGLI